MNPSWKPLCYMNAASGKMLQIPSKMKGSNSRMLQIPLKRQLQLQNVTNVLGKMKGSNSKMLQLARKRAEKSIPKKSKTESNIIPQAILDPEINLSATGFESKYHLLTTFFQ